METPNIIKVIDHVFSYMIRNRNNDMVIRLFEEVTEIYSLTDEVKKTKGVQISLVIESDEALIEVRYSNNSSQLFPFNTLDEKQEVLRFLKKNDIIPTTEEFLAKIPSKKSVVSKNM